MITLALAVLFCVVSTVTMTYMSLVLGVSAWVVPVITMVAMVFLLRFEVFQAFKKEALLIITAGSVGGMIGACVATTGPSFFLQHAQSSFWMFFLKVIALLGVAGLLAFVVASLLRDYLLDDLKLPFPMSQLVYQVIMKDDAKGGSELMLQGGVTVFVWNGLLWLFSLWKRVNSDLWYYVPVYEYVFNIPVFVGLGFIASEVIIKPFFIGLMSQIFFGYFIRSIFFNALSFDRFIITFSIGILLGFLFLIALDYIKQVYTRKKIVFTKSKWFAHAFVFLKTRIAFIFLCVTLFCYVGLMTFYALSFMEQSYILLGLVVLCLITTKIVGRVGGVQMESYVGFLVLSFLYFFKPHASTYLAVLTFSTVCLGLVIDLLFSHKLADLAKISLHTLLKYQFIGFVVSVISVTACLWYCLVVLDVKVSTDFIQEAASHPVLLEKHYLVFCAGLLYSLFLFFNDINLLLVISAFVNPALMTTFYIVGAIISTFFKHKKEQYPFIFGLCGIHAVWVVGRALAT